MKMVEVLAVAIALIVAIANFLLLGIVLLTYVCLAVILAAGGNAVYRWFKKRRAAAEAAAVGDPNV